MACADLPLPGLQVSAVLQGHDTGTAARRGDGAGSSQREPGVCFPPSCMWASRRYTFSDRTTLLLKQPRLQCLLTLDVNPAGDFRKRLETGQRRPIEQIQNAGAGFRNLHLKQAQPGRTEPFLGALTPHFLAAISKYPGLGIGSLSRVCSQAARSAAKPAGLAL